MTDANQYNYPRMKMEYYVHDKFFGPKVGEQAIDFTATTLEGREVKLSDYFGRFLVLETGSISCPVYMQNLPDMNKLANEFPEIKFLLLYVREAHPAAKIHEHRSMQEKIDNANQLPKVEPEKREIIVDDLVGTAHRSYGVEADMVYIFDPTGKIVYRSEWTDAGRVRTVLTEIHKGNTKIDVEKINATPRTKSNLKRIPIAFRVFKRTGWKAAWDLFSQVALLIFKPSLRNGKPK